MMRAACSQRIVSWTLVVGVLGGVTGCSPDTPVSSPANQQTAAPDVVQDDQPRGDLIDEVVVDWDAEVIDANSIRVKFWTGNAHCYGARPVVEETDTEIAIAVFTGRLPESPDVCTEEARQAALLIETQQPVADRDIVPLPASDLSG